MKNILILSTLMFGVLCSGQHLESGFTAGANLTRVYTKSEKSLVTPDGSVLEYSAAPGFELGGFISLPLTNNFSLYNSAGFSRLSSANETDQNFTNSTGEIIYISEKSKLIDNAFYLSPMLNFGPGNHFSLGAGIQLNVLVLSRTNYGKDAPLDFSESINRYYKPLTFSVPVRLACRFNTVGISLLARMGVNDRIKGKDSVITEREGTLSICFNYFL